MPEKLEEDWKADYGEHKIYPTAGLRCPYATRCFQYQNLDTDDLEIANQDF